MGTVATSSALWEGVIIHQKAALGDNLLETFEAWWFRWRRESDGIESLLEGSQASPSRHSDKGKYGSEDVRMLSHGTVLRYRHGHFRNRSWLIRCGAAAPYIMLKPEELCVRCARKYSPLTIYLLNGGLNLFNSPNDKCFKKGFWNYVLTK
jgi:hypothetical protein